MVSNHPARYEIAPGHHRHFAIALVGKTRWLGYNSYKTNPRLLNPKQDGALVFCYHAEIRALLRVPQRLHHKVEIWVTRVRKNGKLAMSKPCQHCEEFLLSHGVSVKNIWYTDESGQWRNLNEERSHPSSGS